MSIYDSLLEFASIRKYLKKAVGSKKTSIESSNIKHVDLPNYLRGIYIFFNEFSNEFNNPSDLIDFYMKNRTNQKELDKIEDEIANYMAWLSEKYAPTTAGKYYYTMCGFLTNNNAIFKFKKYKPKTIKSKNQNKLGINYEEKKRFAEKVKEFIKDQTLRFLVEFSHRTGLSWDTISSINFELLRIRNFDKSEYQEFQETREKTTEDFFNFFSPTLQEYIVAYLRANSDKKDEDLIFGNNKKYAYNALLKKYKRAYQKCVKAYFPKWNTIKTKKGYLKTLFGFHDFRSLFISASTKLRIPVYYINILTAHKQTEINAKNYNSISKELLTVYQEIESELFDKANKSEDAIKKELIDDLLNLINNSGKRKTLYRKSVENNTIDMDYEMQMAIFLETFKNQIIQDVKQEVSNNINEIIKEKLSNLSLKELLTSL